MAATIAGLQAEVVAQTAERAAMAAKVAALEDSLTNLAARKRAAQAAAVRQQDRARPTSDLRLALGDLLATEAKLQADLDGRGSILPQNVQTRDERDRTALDRVVRTRYTELLGKARAPR